MELFSKMPSTRYGSYEMLNIMTKITPIRSYLSRLDVYYDYTIKDGERPDTIAYDYYDDSSYAWLVMIVNDIYDPYHQWPFTYRQFYDYLLAKYGYVHELKNEVSHYIYTGIGGDTADEIARKSYKMSPNTWSYLSAEQKSGWTPVYVYDLENELNENKRKIKLLSNQYKKLVDRQLNEIFASG